MNGRLLTGGRSGGAARWIAAALCCAVLCCVLCAGCSDDDERGARYYEPPSFDVGGGVPAAPEPVDALPTFDGERVGDRVDGSVDVRAGAAETAGPEGIQGLDPLRMALPNYAALYRRVRPAVVTVYATTRPVPPSSRRRPRELATSIGSGIVLSGEGEVLTNQHVVADAVAVWVALADGRLIRARVEGADAPTDLALLKAVGADRGGDSALTAAVLGDSDAVEVGDWVMAVGSPLGLEATVTRGIVSAKGRREVSRDRSAYVDYIQTDAAISSGSSGGPLFDLEGRVIGINAAYSSEGSGIGFAIPANMAREVVAGLREGGRIERGWLGVSVNAPADGGGGLQVTTVVPGSPAEQAGLQPGDILMRLDGEPLESPFDLRWRVAMAGFSTRVRLDIRRGSEPALVSVKLALKR